MSSDLNRRFFLRHILSTVGGAAALTRGAAALSTGLTACSTIDDYLFEDHYNLKDQVLIIGGGLSGLCMAYMLKKNKTEFRLFEGSNRFGGRVRSYLGYDLGASVYFSENKWMKTLTNEFSITSESLEKNNLYLPGGTEILVQNLTERVAGLMPYRNLRLQWKLVSIRKSSSAFEVVFENPRGRRTFLSKRVVLAVPPTQWGSIVGLLDLPEMQQAREWMTALKTENIIKIVVPYSSGNRPSSTKNILAFEDKLFEVRQINKRNKNLHWSEVDFHFHASGQSIEIQKMNEFMKKRMNITINYSRLGTENYFDWQKSQLIGAAYFKNALPWPEQTSSYFQVIGDFATLHNPSTMEGALISAIAASEKIV